MLRTILISLVTLTACGTDIPRPRIVAVDTICHLDFATFSKRHELTYDGERLTDIQTVSHIDDWGSDMTRSEFSYSGERIATVTITEEDESADLSFSHDDTGLREITATYCEDGDCDTSERVYSYTDGRLTSEDRLSDGFLHESREFAWSGDQLRGITSSWGDEGAFDYVDFTYDEAGQLERATYRDGEIVRFRFSDGRLATVSEHDGTRSQLVYDDNGRITEIAETLPSGSRCTTDYTYEDGEVIGIVPVPDLPWGTMFDMTGQTQRNYPVLNTSMFID